MGDYITLEGDEEPEIIENCDDFTSSDCGKYQGVATGVLRVVGPPVRLSINGNPNLLNCVVTYDYGMVEEIKLYVDNAPIYKYTIKVFGMGPRGVGSGSLLLKFFDESGDTYQLRLRSSRFTFHFVRYNSDKPNIVRLEWSRVHP